MKEYLRGEARCALEEPKSGTRLAASLACRSEQDHL